MNIETNNVQSTQTAVNNNHSSKNTNKEGATFADELKTVSKETKTEKTQKEEKDKKAENQKTDLKKDNEKKSVKEEKNVNEALNGLNEAIQEISSLGRIEDKIDNPLKQELSVTDIFDDDKKDSILIDGSMNVPERNDKLKLDMGTNMSFNSNGQPFAEFIAQDKTQEVLKSSAKELAEEKSILSTMEENRCCGQFFF